MSSPVRLTTVKNFLKDRTGMRVGDATAEYFVQVLTTLTEQVADIAKELALEEARNTIMDRDLQTGFEAFLRTEGPGLFSPDTIRNAINGIDNEKLTQLITLLRDDLEATP